MKDIDVKLKITVDSKTYEVDVEVAEEPVRSQIIEAPAIAA